MTRRGRELAWTIEESQRQTGPTAFDGGSVRIERARRLERALGRTLWLVLIGVLIWNSLA